MRDFWLFFALQLVQYFLLTVNFRAVSIGLYGWTFFSDLIVATNGYFIIQKVSNAKSKLGMVGYALGGAIGSVIAIYITKQLYGK